MKIEGSLLILAFAAVILFAGSAEAGCWAYGGACDGSCLYGQVSGPRTFYASDGGVCAASHCGTTYSLYSFMGACSPVGTGSCYKKEGVDRGLLASSCGNGASCGTGGCSGTYYAWSIAYCTSGGGVGSFVGCVYGATCSPYGAVGYAGKGACYCGSNRAIFSCNWAQSCSGLSQATCQSTPGCSWGPSGTTTENLSAFNQTATSYGGCDWKFSVGESCLSDSDCASNYCNEKNDTCTLCNTGKIENAADRCCGDDGLTDIGHLSTDMRYVCNNIPQAPWQWLDAASENRTGDIYPTPLGADYTIISNGSAWIACDIGNVLENFTGDKLNANQILDLSGHEYICYDYNDTGTFAECRGDDATLNQGSANATGINQFATGESIADLVCQANGQWECEQEGYYFNGVQCILPVSLLINGQSGDITINYRQKINASFDAPDGILYRDGDDITSENSVLESLEIGYYNYTLYIPQTAEHPRLIYTIFVNVTNVTIVVAPYVYESCFDYTDKFSCEADDGGVAQVGCSPGRLCVCLWNSTTNNCSMVSRDPNATCDSEFKCIFTPKNYGEAVCEENGFKTIELSAELQRPLPQCEGVSDPDCIDKVVRVPCRGVGFDLPFFGFWQFFSSLIAIALVYAIAGMNRRRYS